jgi:hypothetical protein
MMTLTTITIVIFKKTIEYVKNLALRHAANNWPRFSRGLPCHELVVSLFAKLR